MFCLTWRLRLDSRAFSPRSMRPRSLATLDHPDTVGDLLDGRRPPIITSDAVADAYGLPRKRVQRSGVINVEGHKADYHELHAGEQAVVLEDLASFCALLCAMDDDGNAAMLHAPLFVLRNDVSPTSQGILLEYRRRVDALLRGPRTVAVAGMRGPWTPVIARRIVDLFADTRDLLAQLPGDPLGTNPLPRRDPLEHYSGMLFTPRTVTRDSRDALLLLDECRRKDLGARL